MKPKYLIVDVDDTVVQWSPAFVQWLYDNYYYNIDTHNPISWFTNQNYIKEFNNYSMQFLTRKPIYSMVDLVIKLGNTHRIKVMFLSACGESAKDRQEFVVDQYFKGKLAYTLEVVNSSHNKLSFVKNLIESEGCKAILLDDKIETVIEFVNNGIPATSAKDDVFLPAFIFNHFGI